MAHLDLNFEVVRPKEFLTPKGELATQGQTVTAVLPDDLEVVALLFKTAHAIGSQSVAAQRCSHIE